MLPDSFDILHVFRFFVAGDQQVYKVEEREYNESYVEDVVFIEGRVES